VHAAPRRLGATRARAAAAGHEKTFRKYAVSGQTNRIPDCVTDCQRFNTTYATTSLGKKEFALSRWLHAPNFEKAKTDRGVVRSGETPAVG